MVEQITIAPSSFQATTDLILGIREEMSNLFTNIPILHTWTTPRDDPPLPKQAHLLNYLVLRIWGDACPAYSLVFPKDVRKIKNQGQFPSYA